MFVDVLGRRASDEPDLSRKIISPSRAQNVAIVLSRLGQPVEDIANKIDCIDSSGLERDVVEKVIDVRMGLRKPNGFKKTEGMRG